MLRFFQAFFRMCLLSLTGIEAACNSFGTIDLGYAKHKPTYISNTSVHNVTYATYANIRFAQPPTGDRRFRAPVTPPPTEHGVQSGIVPLNSTDCLITIPAGLEIGPGLAGASWGSEDCLFLDVKVPEGVEFGSVPVLHWLYGGGYLFGSKTWAGDPATLFDDMSPDQKFITVSSNYRMGAPGWISAPGEDMIPNAGLWDALTALEWTQQYIGLFGGDPDRITAIGESSGGGMIQHLLTMKGGEGTVPFSQAIITSPGYRPHVNTSDQMRYMYQTLLNATNCSSTACLRQIPQTDMARANAYMLNDVPSQGWLGPGIGYNPIIDGDLVLDLPDRLMQQGKFHKEVTRVLTSNMVNDGEYETVLNVSTWDLFLKQYMRHPSAQTIQMINATYNVTGTQADFDAFSRNALFGCHALFTARAYNTRAYRYSMSIPPATHGQDQFYYLFSGNLLMTPVAEPGGVSIAKQMQNYFREFITGGKGPGYGNSAGENVCDVGGNVTYWPSYGYGELERWMNVTIDGFELVQGEDTMTKQCEQLMDIIYDPANGF